MRNKLNEAVACMFVVPSDFFALILVLCTVYCQFCVILYCRFSGEFRSMSGCLPGDKETS